MKDDLKLKILEKIFKDKLIIYLISSKNYFNKFWCNCSIYSINKIKNNELFLYYTIKISKFNFY